MEALTARQTQPDRLVQCMQRRLSEETDADILVVPATLQPQVHMIP